jgi:hypothetical protein
MKTVIMEKEDKDNINFSEINSRRPIFAKKEGRLVGMVTKNGEGWILSLGCEIGATGYHESLKQCMEDCVSYGYTFHVED